MQNISKEVSRGAFALYLTLPLLIFALINEPIYRSLHTNSLLFFLDALNKAIVPAAMCWYLLSKNILSRKELGIAPQNLRQFIEDCVVCIPALLILSAVLQRLLWIFLWPYDWILHSHLFAYRQMIPQDFTLHWLMVFYFSITAALSEEFYFRGVLRFSTFALIRNKQTAKWVFILGSALLFGLTHWKTGLTNMTNAFFFGLVAARLYLWTNSLWPLMAAHFLVDMAFI
jgi:membrane protease YdiL (CAAX protease family)